MTGDVELLAQIRSIIRLYDRESAVVRERYGVTQPELDIVGFLANQPEHDTATEIVELRMLPKANVSQAVELLIRRGYLTRATDAQDRRRVHLTLTPEAAPLIRDIRASRRRVADALFSGFSPEDMARFEELNRRIASNAREAL